MADNTRLDHSSCNTFCDLNLHPSLLAALNKVDLIWPSPAQLYTIDAALKGESVILQSKSGTGKTLSFCIIILQRLLAQKEKKVLKDVIMDAVFEDDGIITPPSYGEVIVLVPTRELATQIQETLQELSSSLCDIVITLNMGGSGMLQEANELVTRKPNVIVATPGRLKTLFVQYKRLNTEFSGPLNSKSDIWQNMHILVLDEADMLLDEQFIGQTRGIFTKLINPFVQLIAVSATFMKPQLKYLEDLLERIDLMFVDNCNKLLDKCLSIDDMLRFLPQSFTMNWLENAKIIELSKTVEHADANGHHNASHSAYGRALSNIASIKHWFNGTKRKLTKIILSSSHASRFDYSTAFTYNNQEKNEIGDLDDSGSPCLVGMPSVKDFHEIRTCCERDKVDASELICTPVLRKIEFYLAKVPDAPSIIRQIGLKMECIITILSSVIFHKCIIFCNQSHTRVQAAGILQRLGFPCFIASSRLSHSERMSSLSDMEIGNKKIMICTDIMSRGINFSDVDMVINMDVPTTKEIFLHRSGRAGRFGRNGICICICTHSELEMFDYFLFVLGFPCISVVELLKRTAKSDLKFVDDDGMWCYDPLEGNSPHSCKRISHLLNFDGIYTYNVANKLDSESGFFSGKAPKTFVTYNPDECEQKKITLIGLLSGRYIYFGKPSGDSIRLYMGAKFVDAKFVSIFIESNDCCVDETSNYIFLDFLNLPGTKTIIHTSSDLLRSIKFPREASLPETIDQYIVIEQSAYSDDTDTNNGKARLTKPAAKLALIVMKCNISGMKLLRQLHRSDGIEFVERQEGDPEPPTDPDGIRPWLEKLSGIEDSSSGKETAKTPNESLSRLINTSINDCDATANYCYKKESETKAPQTRHNMPVDVILDTDHKDIASQTSFNLDRSFGTSQRIISRFKKQHMLYWSIIDPYI